MEREYEEKNRANLKKIGELEQSRRESEDRNTSQASIRERLNADLQSMKRRWTEAKELLDESRLEEKKARDLLQKADMDVAHARRQANAAQEEVISPAADPNPFKLAPLGP